MDNNKRRYRNILRKMNLQEEDIVNDALKKKGFYSSSNSDIYPLSSLHFELTSRCNAFCKHCYNNSGKSNEQDRMGLKQWIDFTQYIVGHGGVFECLISGGEPLLLGEGIFDIMDIMHDDGTIFLFMTNAYLLSKEYVEKFSKYKYHWFQISIDGASAEYHDKFRRLPGSWERAIKGAENIVEAGVPLKIAHCVTPYNLEGIDEMCALAADIGASSIMLGGISLSGRTGFNREFLLSDDDIHIMRIKIEENRQKFKGKLKVRSANSVKSGLVNHSKHPRSGAVIRPNGDIRIDGMAPFIAGNILDDDFTDIWTNKISECWSDIRVRRFIEEFDSSDHNNNFVNYLQNDIYL